MGYELISYLISNVIRILTFFLMVYLYDIQKIQSCENIFHAHSKMVPNICETPIKPWFLGDV